MNRRHLPVFVAAAVGLLAGAFITDAVLARSRTLHVVNGFADALRVTVQPGGVEARVPAGGRVELQLAEGSYRASAQLARPAGPLALEDVPFELGGDGFAGRWLGRTAFVLAPGGGAALSVEEAIYGPSAPPPTPGTLVAGAPFVALTGLDLAFAPFPQQEAAGRWRRVTQLTGSAPGVLARLGPEARAAEGALAYAEAHLRVSPADPALIDAYLAVAAAGAGTARARRARAFLQAGLAAAPARERLAWHRAYQDLARALGDEAAVREEYGRRLAAAQDAPPEERAALHYLSGRVAAEAAAARSAYQAALASDPTFGYAHRALAVVALREARFARGLEHALAACAARPGDAAAAGLRDELRLALGQAALLRAELDAARAAEPLDFAPHLRHLAALVAVGEEAAAREAQQAFRQRVEARGHDRHQLSLLSELRLRYLTGDFAGLLERSQAVRDPERRARLRLEALLELDRPQEAAPLIPAGPGAGPLALLLALTHARLGEAEAAATWRERAAQAFAQQGGPAERQAAALLRREGAPTTAARLAERARPLDLPPPVKAALLLAVAAARPAGERAPLLDLAQRYAFRPGFPHRLLARTAAWLRRP